MSYTAPIYTIPAGERLEIPGEGKFVRVLEASDWFDLGLDDAPLHFIEQGLAVESPGFKKVVLRNPQSGPITVRLGVASGVIHDSRFSVPGTMPVQVENFPAAAVVAEKDKPGVVPVGESFVSLINTSGVQTVVTPASNVNGVILRITSIDFISGNETWLIAATSAPASSNGVDGKRIFHARIFPNAHSLPNNIYVKPGEGVYYRCENGANRLYINYDIL